MTMSDPIADMLTRIRNASFAKNEYTDVPASSVKKEILKILKEEGFIGDFKMAEEEGHPWIRVYLKFSPKGENVIQGIDRVSVPGCRSYVGSENIPRVLGGLGVTILSTSKGVISGRKARAMHVGGELLCKVW